MMNSDKLCLSEPQPDMPISHNRSTALHPMESTWEETTQMLGMMLGVE
jgi:hypothetical protein